MNGSLQSIEFRPQVAMGDTQNFRDGNEDTIYEAKGEVEYWLQDLEFMMRQSLQQ